MHEGNRLPEASFGFARNSTNRQLEHRSSRHSVENPDNDQEPLIKESLPVEERQAESAGSPPGLGHEGWIVRPKPTKPAGPASPARDKTIRARRASPHDDGLPAAELSTPGGTPSRRWLAIGLACMVYVVGVAGLWSMIESFETTEPQRLTPAEGTRMLPPLDETIDVRDIGQDDPPAPAT